MLNSYCGGYYYPPFEMKFENLKELNIFQFNNRNFNVISKFKFPNLEFVCIENYKNHVLPMSFYHQIENIKTLKCKYFDWFN